jgi:hypothetical protein
MVKVWQTIFQQIVCLQESVELLLGKPNSFRGICIEAPKSSPNLHICDEIKIRLRFANLDLIYSRTAGSELQGMPSLRSGTGKNIYINSI